MRRQSEDSAMIQVTEKRVRLDSGILREEEEEEDRNMKDNESNKRIDKKEVKVLKSLGNCDVMEHLAIYLNNQDLGSLNDTCVTVADSIDALSLWRKRAHKLSEILGCSRGYKKAFDYIYEESAHYRELCYSLQKDVKVVAERLRENIEYRRHKDISLEEITDAARLAHYGMLGSVRRMRLSNVDLASVPAEHLASLASCVTEYVSIYNVSNCDLVSILDNLKCEWVFINSQTLSSEETRAMVRAMESRVKRVVLRFHATDRGEMRLDIRALTQYSGQGKCGQVEWYGDAADRYREEVMSWAQRINWDVKIYSYAIVMSC